MGCYQEDRGEGFDKFDSANWLSQEQLHTFFPHGLLFFAAGRLIGIRLGRPFLTGVFETYLAVSRRSPGPGVECVYLSFTLRSFPLARFVCPVGFGRDIQAKPFLRQWTTWWTYVVRSRV